MATKKKYTYNVSASWILKETGKQFSFMTQLYQIGVYFIMNNDPSAQAGLSPSQMQKMCKQLKKELDNGIITDLVFGREITVSENENNSLWYEVN